MIEVKNLSYIYEKGMPYEKEVLHDVSFTIPDGDFVALIGHTGSGKSTLTQQLNALLKPSSGSIIIDGVDITGENADLKEVRRKVGLVFQYPEHQLFEDTVYNDIAFGPKNMGLSPEEIDERVKAAIKLVGLSESKLEKSPFELSGGQKRRVAIAGVLSMEPKVLILDEPTAGLDPKGRDEILGQIVKLHSERKDMTVIFVSHSMEEVARLAQHVIVMNKGSVAMNGTVGEVFSRSEELAKCGLSVPQITKLAAELIKRGVNLRSDIYTVDYAAGVIKNLIRGGGENA